ncbi:MAG: hypothetical protein JXA03_08925 [Bacteroidales bacterium]|nr:hypothetical protein [Bacteroidales bacterium]
MKCFIILTAVVTVAVNACNERKTRFEGIPVTGFYTSCNIVSDFGETITIGDPDNKFMMTFPYAWDISEIYSDTLYGIIAFQPPADTGQIHDYMSVSVFGYQSDLSLTGYTIQEIKNLKNDRYKKVKETGELEIKERKARWVWFEDRQDNPGLENIVVYIRNDAADEVFIIQSSVLKKKDSAAKLCELKNLVMTFEFID